MKLKGTHTIEYRVAQTVNAALQMRIAIFSFAVATLVLIVKERCRLRRGNRVGYQDIESLFQNQTDTKHKTKTHHIHYDYISPHAPFPNDETFRRCASTSCSSHCSWSSSLVTVLAKSWMSPIALSATSFVTFAALTKSQYRT